jgi:hypothetical protein
MLLSCRSLGWALVAGLGLSAVGLTTVGRAAEFSEMLGRVPGDTNVLVMIDADRLFNSPLAREQGWKKKLATQQELHPVLLPVGAKKLVRAIELDVQSGTQTKELTLLDFPKGPSLQKIADKQQGYLEKVANADVAWLPQGAYGTRLGQDLYGFLFPANRQELSGWLRSRSGKISTYLLQASTGMKQSGPQIVLAMDLEDAVTMSQLEAKLKSLKSISESQVDIPAITKVMGSLRGARLAVTFGAQANGTLTIDFEESVAPLKSVAQALVLETLAQRGLSIDELESWTTQVEGKSIVMTGPLGDSGLMRLSSLAELPSQLIEDPEIQTDSTNPQLYATQAHFKSVDKLVQDLFKKEWTTFGQYAKWAESYARKIDRLPLLNVDEEMQQYSAGVADLLRQGAESFRGVGIRSYGRQSQVWNSNFVNYDYFGNRYYGNYNAGDQARRAIGGEERMQGALDSATLRREVEQRTGDIRKKMVTKYKVEF